MNQDMDLIRDLLGCYVNSENDYGRDAGGEAREAMEVLARIEHDLNNAIHGRNLAQQALEGAQHGAADLRAERDSLRARLIEMDEKAWVMSDNAGLTAQELHRTLQERDCMRAALEQCAEAFEFLARYHFSDGREARDVVKQALAFRGRP